jgi:hypothetical protein
MNAQENISIADQLCMNCKTPYNTSELYCSTCGYILPHTFSGSTVYLEKKQSKAVDLQWGTGYFHQRAQLFLRLADSQQLIKVPLAKSLVVLGRGSDTDEAHVDLTPYGAFSLGVSRRHVCVYRMEDELLIADMESANGTYLNRTRLVPGERHILRNRAVLQLGQMVLRVQFA